MIAVAVMLIKQLHAQGMPSVSKLYSYETINMKGLPRKYTFYFILSKELTIIKNKKYNALTFSEDTTGITGYVRYDSIDKQIYYLSTLYERNSAKDSIFNTEQRFISFFNDTVNYTGSIDGKIISTVKDDGTVVIEFFSNEQMSDVISVDELIFSKGFLYPSSIVIFDTYFNKSVTLHAK